MALIIARFNFIGNTDSVVKGREGAFNPEIWNPIIARTVNEKDISFAVDAKEVEIEEEQLYMDESLSVMIPTSYIKENFQCAANIYDKSKLVIEKNDHKLEFELGSDYMYINGARVKLSAPMTFQNGELFVPVEAVAEGLNYDFNWDIASNAVNVMGNEESDRILPYSYDLREAKITSKVKNQGQLGTCWAFASLTALESSIAPEESLVLSPDHMSIQNSFHAGQNDGGEYTMAMAYLTSWQGPVLEKDDPYADGKSPDDIKAVKHVQEIQVIEGKDYEEIKLAVFQYGGVQSSLYTSLTSAASQSIYYNRKESAYCFIGTDKPNHDVVIVGWDDNYPKEKFNVKLEGDGAFICQNSWGSKFGNDGFFYVSYYDTNIGMHNVVYTDVEDTDNYDNLYQSDLCGWVGQLGYGKESSYFANVYEAKNNETIEAVGFYATGKDTEYEIYAVPEFQGTESLQDRILLKTGYFKNAGFYTVDFDEGIKTESGKKFAIVINITTPNSVHPIAIEYKADAATSTVDLSDGEGYISLRGTKWEDVEENQECNLCLKVYTDNR